jgi:hypothetical protein
MPLPGVTLPGQWSRTCQKIVLTGIFSICGNQAMKKFLLLLSLFACTAYADDMPTYKLELKDGTLNPARIVVPVDTKFRLEVHNTGKTPVEFESTQLRKEKVLAPGATSVVVIQPLDKGEYKFFDEFHMATAKGVIVAE